MRRCALGLLAGVLLLVSGCWSRIEVVDLGVVIGMGIDTGETAPVRATLYFSRSPGGAQGEGLGGTANWVVSREGQDVPEAVRNIAQASSRRISLHHLRVVLVGESYARGDMDSLMDFLARYPQIRLITRVMVVEGTAQEVLETPPQFEALQPESIAEIVRMKGGPDPKLKDLMVARAAESFTGWTYTVHVIDRPSREPGASDRAVELSGAALLRADRVVTVLDRRLAQSLGWLEGDNKLMVITVPCPDLPAATLTAQVDQGRARIVPELTGGQLRFAVVVKGYVDIITNHCNLDSLSPAARAKMEEAITADVSARLKETIAVFQETETDPVGFGKRVQLKHTAYWRKIKKEWLRVWADTPVTVSGHVSIRRTGLLLRPANRTREELEANK
jgi:spore germination protein KC